MPTSLLRSLLVVTTMSLAAVSCGRDQEMNDNIASEPAAETQAADPSTEEAAPDSRPDSGSGAQEIAEIPVTDELGSFGSAVSGIALWAHPNRAYDSLVLAANGEAGLILVDLERGSPDTATGDFSAGVAVGYPDWAEGNESVIAAWDAASGYRFFDIAPEGLELLEWETTGADALPSNPAEICLVAVAERAMLNLVVIDDEGAVSTSFIKQNGDSTISVSSPSTVNVPEAVACTSDDEGGRMLIASENGEIHALGTGAETSGSTGPQDTEIIVTLADGTVNDIATSLQTGQGQLLVHFEGDDSLIHAYDLASFEPIGQFSVVALTDTAGVSGITAIAADGGNYGTIYRKGVIATIGSGQAQTLKLAPLSAALRQWQLYDAEVRNRRDITQYEEQSEEFEFTPTIEIVPPPDL